MKYPTFFLAFLFSLSFQVNAEVSTFSCVGTKKLKPETNTPSFKDHSFSLKLDLENENVIDFPSAISSSVFWAKGKGDNIEHRFTLKIEKENYKILEEYQNHDTGQKNLVFLIINKKNHDSGGSVFRVYGEEKAVVIEQFRGRCTKINF